MSGWKCIVFKYSVTMVKLLLVVGIVEETSTSFTDNLARSRLQLNPFTRKLRLTTRDPCSSQSVHKKLECVYQKLFLQRPGSNQQRMFHVMRRNSQRLLENPMGFVTVPKQNSVIVNNQKENLISNLMPRDPNTIEKSALTYRELILNGIKSLKLLSIIENCSKKCKIWRTRVRFYNCMKSCQHENNLLQKQSYDTQKQSYDTQKHSYNTQKPPYDAQKQSHGKQDQFKTRNLPQYDGENLNEEQQYSQEDTTNEESAMNHGNSPDSLAQDMNLKNAALTKLFQILAKSSNYLPPAYNQREKTYGCPGSACSRIYASKRVKECIDSGCSLETPRKRRWGDVLTTCINSYCSSLDGAFRADCIINKCDKQRRGK